MAKVTVEVPDSMVGDLYIRVGAMLRRAQEELDEASEDVEARQPSDAEQADEEV